MNEEWLNAFVAFAERLSFTEAARALHISQPALHVQVKKLSESLGLMLYRKAGRSLILTREGEQLLAFGRERAERTARFLEGLKGRPRERPVVLSAGAGAYQYMLGDAIRAFARQKLAPLTLRTQDRDAALRAVAYGESHLGVGVIDDVPEAIATRAMRQVGAAVVVAKRHPLAKKRRVRLTDLRGARLIVPPEGRPHRVAIARAMQSAGVPFDPAMEASGWELLMHFARLELGVAVVNDFCVPPAGCVIRPLLGLPRVTYHVFWRRDQGADDAIIALREAILAG